MRSLKIFGAAALAMLAISAITASSAFATYDQALTGEAAKLEGAQVTTNILTTVSGTVKCEEATFSGNGKSTSTMEEPTAGTTTYAELELHPTYGKCKAFGLAATVTTTGCVETYRVTTPTFFFLWHSVVVYSCTGTNKIVVNAGAGGCVVEIGSQSPGGVVKLENEAGGTLLETFEIEAIQYHQEGAKCTGGTGTFSNGTYTGTARLAGKNPNNNNPVSISVT